MKTDIMQRVVVLGREGAARDQLVAALGGLGVEPVWVGRPKQNNPDALLALNPNKIVVSLEPAIELELEPYSEVLGQPGISVVYDDAESSKGLDGWDLNRWARHFAAKLLGRSPMPPLPVAKPEVASAQPLAALSAELAFSEIPVADDFSEDSLSENPSEWQRESQDEDLEIDQNELQKALEQLDQSLAQGYSPETDLELSFEQLVPLTEEENELLMETGTVEESNQAEPELIFSMDLIEKNEDTALPSFEDKILTDDEELKSFLSIAAATVDMPLNLPVPEIQTSRFSADTPLELAPDDMLFESEQQPKAVALPDFDLSKYTLVGDEMSDEAAVETDVKSQEENTPQTARVRDGGKSGLFLVVSGLGGPGALRSLLEQIPADFQGIVALSHQIPAAQLPAFKDQLQKVSKLPVEAIEENDYFKTCNIYLMPQNVTLFKTPLGYQCIRGGLDKFIDQIDHDAEILILSGADPALSQSLIQVNAVSNNIHVQNPDECYESGLVRQLINAGAPILNRDKIEQWFN
jgi:chemotaxis response regulator CheB